jgi:hypothetical protein
MTERMIEITINEVPAEMGPVAKGVMRRSIVNATVSPTVGASLLRRLADEWDPPRPVTRRGIVVPPPIPGAPTGTYRAVPREATDD